MEKFSHISLAMVAFQACCMYIVPFGAVKACVYAIRGLSYIYHKRLSSYLLDPLSILF